MRGPETPLTCGAKTRAGTPCKLPPMPNGRCYRHGGATPSGVASPHFKHGRYSRTLPARLVASYHEAQQDRSLLELRDEIALVTVSIQDAFYRAGLGNSRWVLEELRKVLRKLRKARRKGNTRAEDKALDRLEELASTHGEDPKALREAVRLIEHKRKLIESERKRLVEARVMISAEEVMALVAVLTDSVRRHVDDPAVLAALNADIQRVVDAQPCLRRRRLLPSPPILGTADE